jgi:hypothetical protein
VLSYSEGERIDFLKETHSENIAKAKSMDSFLYYTISRHQGKLLISFGNDHLYRDRELCLKMPS